MHRRLKVHAGTSQPHLIRQGGAPSKVKEMGPLVPTTAPTVTLVYAGVRLLKDVPIRHCVVVADVHAEVLHSVSRIAASVGVKP
jgi:hypothetical protein